MATKKEISDSVLYKLAGGIPDTSFPIDERQIWNELEHKLNSLFKLRHLDVTLNSGETIPENTMIATYTGITVTPLPSSGQSQAALPVIPISLPKGMGIYLIYPDNKPDMPFIPIQRGQRGLLRVDSLLNDMMGQISYEPKNSVVVFSKDITLLGLSTLTMELCVFDISQYSVTADLPIPADYIDQIEGELVKEFAPIVGESGLVNNFSSTEKGLQGNENAKR